MEGEALEHRGGGVSLSQGPRLRGVPAAVVKASAPMAMYLLYLSSTLPLFCTTSQI